MPIRSGRGEVYRATAHDRAIGQALQLRRVLILFSQLFNIIYIIRISRWRVGRQHFPETPPAPSPDPSRRGLYRLVRRMNHMPEPASLILHEPAWRLMSLYTVLPFPDPI